MVQIVNWEKKVVEDYRERIIIDPDSPLLAFKANRDRYTNLPNQKDYAGLPHLGSRQSEDALTWNVFRSLQKTGQLGIVTHKLRVGEPRGLLLWTLAPEIDDINAGLQYFTGSLIRRFDGILPGQITEPDIIILATAGVAVIECKLSEPDKAPSHLWEGELDSVKKRLFRYKSEIPNLIKMNLKDDEVAPVYQLVRLAFYAAKLGAILGVEPVLVSLSNQQNWPKKINRLHKSPSDLWEAFCNHILGEHCPRCEGIFWQDIRDLIMQVKQLETLSAYLSRHPCL